MAGRGGRETLISPVTRRLAEEGEFRLVLGKGNARRGQSSLQFFAIELLLPVLSRGIGVVRAYTEDTTAKTARAKFAGPFSATDGLLPTLGRWAPVVSLVQKKDFPSSAASTIGLHNIYFKYCAEEWWRDRIWKLVHDMVQ